MNNELKVLINSRYNKLSELLIRTEKKLKSFPDGRIKVRHIGNATYYYYVGAKSNERLISKSNSALIADLLQKDYLKK